MKIDINKFNELVDQKYLKYEKHPLFDLLVWKYTKHCQYEQYWTHETLMCRSLVTDSEGNIFSYCIPKFFNWEENRHIPTEDYIIQEKLDGQLVYMFYYNNTLVIRSGGSFVSEVVSNVKELIKDELEFRCSLKLDYTYCFELTGKRARIVVDYHYELKLTHLTTFNNKGEEVDVTPVTEIVKEYSMTSLQELKDRDVDNEEGYVIKYSNGNRCKIKFDNYIQKHFFNFALSTTLVWGHLKDGTLEDFLPTLPDESYNLTNAYALKLLLQIESIRRRIEWNISILKTLDVDRKELYEFSKNLSYSELTLAYYDNKTMFLTENIYKMIKPEFKIL